MRPVFLLLAMALFNLASGQVPIKEKHRPQFHFSPSKHWMNDPNGMFFLNGTYHLYFQHYPGGTKWGPMHWGHATSSDLVHWQEQPIALYPDSLGYIFSGSAVVDHKNTSGFGKDGKIPIVAIFTHHDTAAENARTGKHQSQSIAYSLDEGTSWTKYVKNPVIANPGIWDFRDPKVMWHQPSQKWIMTLATKDRITFYSSPDLREWKKESEFGERIGAHGGVWECPDLFPLHHNGKQHWVLLVSINPGGPNGGSATQYFIGDFDGSKFSTGDTATRWVDYGTDNYAGVTFSNTGDRKIFIGWMSNWQYAERVPTQAWRSAMTVARDMELREVGGSLYLNSKPVVELKRLNIGGRAIEGNGRKAIIPAGLYGMEGSAAADDFSIVLSNDVGEKLIIGFEKAGNRFYIDRTGSGDKSFDPEFAKKQFAPRISDNKEIKLTMFVDHSSVELFADDGLTVMTAIFFPSTPYTNVSIEKGTSFKGKVFKISNNK